MTTHKMTTEIHRKLDHDNRRDSEKKTKQQEHRRQDSETSVRRHEGPKVSAKEVAEVGRSASSFIIEDFNDDITLQGDVGSPSHDKPSASKDEGTDTDLRGKEDQRMTDRQQDREVVRADKRKKKKTESDEENEEDSDGEVFEFSPEVTIQGKLLQHFWKMRPGKDGDSLFIKNAAKAVWGDAHLAVHSVVGRKSSKKEAWPPLDKPRLERLRDFLKERCRRENPDNPQSDRYDSVVINKYLAEKIKTVRRSVNAT